jgi:hypothetical protein
MGFTAQKSKIRTRRVAFDHDKQGLHPQLRPTQRYIQLRPSPRTLINGPSRRVAPVRQALKHGTTAIRKESSLASTFWMIVARSGPQDLMINATCFMISSRRALYTIYRVLVVFRSPKSSFQTSAMTTS